MDEINERLLELYREACRYAPGSPRRNKILTRMIWLMDESGGLSKRSSQYYDYSYYEDALQQTRSFFVEHLCQRNGIYR